MLCTPVSAFARPEVALIHSTPRSTAWTDGIASGMASVIGKKADISEIYLGTPQEDDEFFETRYQQIISNWGKSLPAVVVTDGSLAFAFMRKYREDLFVGVPVVYCGMARPEPELLRQCGDCTGIPLEVGVRQTLDLLFALRPTTSTVVGIMDDTPSSLHLRRLVEAAMEPYLDRARLLFPGFEPGDDEGLDTGTLKSVASSVPRSGAVLFLEFNVDNKGDPVDSAEVVALLAERSDGPVFVLSDEWLHQSVGLVAGGSVVRADAQGAATGRTVLRILQGEGAREMLPETVQPSPLVDLTALARFGITRSNVPMGTRTLNAPVQPVQDGRIASNDMVLGLTGLTVVLGVFLWLRRRRLPK